MDIEYMKFDIHLWGQCEKLHQRIINKIDYYKNIYKILEPIYNSFTDLNRKLDNLKIEMDPTIYLLDSNNEKSDKNIEWSGFPLTLKLIIEYFNNIINVCYKIISELNDNLESFIKRMKLEKKDYEEFQKSNNLFKDSKKNMDKCMKKYHQKMIVGEMSVLDLKKFIEKTSTITDNNDNNINILENKANQLINDAIKPYQTYQESINKSNELREKYNKNQKDLLCNYQNIEEEVYKLNTIILEIIYSNLNNSKNLIEEKIGIFDINRNNNNHTFLESITQIINKFAGDEKPEEKINFINFPSSMDFNAIDNNETFRIYKESIKFIKNKITDEFQNYNEQLEEDKNDLRNVIDKIIKSYSPDLEKSIINFSNRYINKGQLHDFFLSILNKYKEDKYFMQNENFIKLFGKIFNKILDISQNINNYEIANYCIILSETFYYKIKNEFYYLSETISKHKWLNSLDFWINFLDIIIGKEIDLFITKNSIITKDDILYNTDKLDDKLKAEASELLFVKYLIYVNHMKKLQLNKTLILEITEKYCEKYKLLQKDYKKIIIGLITDYKGQKEIPYEVKNKIPENPNEKKNVPEKNISKINNNKEANKGSMKILRKESVPSANPINPFGVVLRKVNTTAINNNNSNISNNNSEKEIENSEKNKYYRNSINPKKISFFESKEKINKDLKSNKQNEMTKNKSAKSLSENKNKGEELDESEKKQINKKNNLIDKKIQTENVLDPKDKTKISNKNNVSEKKLMSLIFISDSEDIYWSIICEKSDSFLILENSFFKNYPECNKSKIYFMFKGVKIKKEKSLQDLGIRHNDIIYIKGV